VLIATIVVFIIDLVGNSIGFGHRFLSALMSAIVFALVFGTLVYSVTAAFDVSDDDAECNCPCSNAKVGRPNRNAGSLLRLFAASDICAAENST